MSSTKWRTISLSLSSTLSELPPVSFIISAFHLPVLSWPPSFLSSSYSASILHCCPTAGLTDWTDTRTESYDANVTLHLQLQLYCIWPIASTDNVCSYRTHVTHFKRKAIAYKIDEKIWVDRNSWKFTQCHAYYIYFNLGKKWAFILRLYRST